MGRTLDAITDFAFGFGMEQSFTTFNRLTIDFLDRSPRSSKDETCSFCGGDDDFGDGYGTALLGAAIGAITDLTLLGYSISYLSGNQSKLASISAAAVGTKIALNALSYVASNIYRSHRKDNSQSN